MINAIDASSVLLPEFETFLPDDEDVLKKEMKQRDDHYIESFNEFTKCQRKYKPFYSKEIFKLTDEMMGQMNRISFNFRKYMSGENYEYVVPLHKEIDKESKKVSEMIKNELPSNNYL
ncbi:MAG: hypothetical protein O7C56_10015 [Rickettsia endosymbiont of Ixodes persulcatus]|nr:hypothetical protein [Rickettsia endosymbiont of Ixodes persulcatus]